MVTVIQRYYALPGMAAAVLETRFEASRRLAAMGLPSGIVLTPPRSPSATPETPDVVWICSYPDLAERERLRQAAESDAEFAAIRARQARQLTRFERDHLEALGDTEVLLLGDGRG